MDNTIQKKNFRSQSNRFSAEKNIEEKKFFSSSGYKMTEERIKETLYIIVKALNDKDIDSMKKMFLEYEFLIGIGNSRLRSYFGENNMMYTFANFLQVIISEPMKDWLFPKSTKMPIKDILGEDVLVVGRRINESVEEYIGSYRNLMDEEQNLIRPMLIELRQFKTNKKVQELYTIIRDNLVAKHGEFDYELNRPISNIWTPKEKTLFDTKLAKHEFELPNMCKFFREECFEEIIGPLEIEICNNCGLPMRFINGEYECINNVTCKHNELVVDLDRRKLKLKDGERVFVVKEGIGFYITRTGIEETLVYNIIKDKYVPLGWVVVKYPGQDADGDILMYRDNISILIDLKDYVNAKTLQVVLEKSPGQYKEKDIIYIPQYRKEIYELKGTLSSLKSMIKRELKRENGTAPALAYKGNLIATINKIIKEKMKGEIYNAN